MNVRAIVLAAGQGSRFGSAKPAVPFRGSTLLQMVIESIPVKDLIVVGTEANLEGTRMGSGARVLLNLEPSRGMGYSIALGVREAAGADVVLIALGDMPLVPRFHFEALVGAIRTPRDIAATRPEGETRLMVPAAFGSEHFEALSKLDGDRGARHLFGPGTMPIEVEGRFLVDIDRPEDLDFD